MMVIFTSQSDKRARKTTRWILDAFAERIGSDTWQTLITQDGLEMVKGLLRRHATKSMAVSCRWIRSRSRSELLWIVGNRSRFNAEGVVPVNTTQKNIRHEEWENSWQHLPQIVALSAVAGLLHDIGKSSASFQRKLRDSTKATDEFRHEWLSCQIIRGLVTLAGDAQDDAAWLQLLLEGGFEVADIEKLVNDSVRQDHTLSGLPPIAGMLCWLILSHHLLPALDRESCAGFDGVARMGIEEMLTDITAKWGYQHEDVKEEVHFAQGLLLDSQPWRKMLKRWISKLLEQQEALVGLAHSADIRLLLFYARLCLMLADYYASSQAATDDWQGQDSLYANTDKGQLKQKLDEHLTKVSAQAARIAHALPRFSSGMEYVHDVKVLRHRSPQAFAWQDRAVGQIHGFRAAAAREGQEQVGWFVVNMASTGCGKTFANAKIMQALSPDEDSLRYILALGLRTLTLQTGEEYQRRIGLSANEMAVLVGSAAVQELYRKNDEAKTKRADGESYDTAAMEELIEGELHGNWPAEDEFLTELFDMRKSGIGKKNLALLYQPVLAMTIDHIMPAVTTVRGGHHLLPSLRLLSSDIVIDEIDDFSPEDLYAIARLVHLAGMLGRNVVISSATIPPDLAEGLFIAYRAGRNLYDGFFDVHSTLAGVWCDEFRTQVGRLNESGFAPEHRRFIAARVAALGKQVVKRKGRIWDCSEIMAQPVDDRNAAYYDGMMRAALELHQKFALRDKKTGKRVSFGLIRMNNIKPCVDMGRYLLNAECPAGIELRVMVYHSRQVLALRHEQEAYLDRVLRRKGMDGDTLDLTDPDIRRHIDDASQAHDILFILVATPVEEVGRDHDLDWAVIEPSSYRSIIQLAGRILRHRHVQADIGEANVIVMSHNLRGLREAGGKKEKRAFYRPGFETCSRYALNRHDLRELVDEGNLSQRIDAAPRIQKPAELRPHDRFIDLEHQVMQDFRESAEGGAEPGPSGLHGWLAETWWLTGVVQRRRPFREGSPDIELCYCYEAADNRFHFCERDQRTGEYIDREKFYGIEMDEVDHPRLWLRRDYRESLLRLEDDDDIENPDGSEDRTLIRLSRRYGGLVLPCYKETDDATTYHYSDSFGLYME